MAETPETPPTSEPVEPAAKEPTPAELMAMIESLSAEVAEAKTAAEAHSTVEAGLTAQGVSDEDAAKIADGVIAGLEARGVFAEDEPVPPTPAVPEPVAGGPSPENGPTGTPPPAEAAPTDDKPHKRTFAERFAGRQ